MFVALLDMGYAHRFLQLWLVRVLLGKLIGSSNTLLQVQKRGSSQGQVALFLCFLIGGPVLVAMHAALSWGCAPACCCRCIMPGDSAFCVGEV